MIHAILALCLLLPMQEEEKPTSTITKRRAKVPFSIKDSNDIDFQHTFLWIREGAAEKWIRHDHEEAKDYNPLFGMVKDGKIWITVTLPGNGDFYFYLQSKDQISNQMPAPIAGTKAHNSVRVKLPEEKKGPKFLQPRGGEIAFAGDRIVLNWKTMDPKHFQDNTAVLYYRTENGSWTVINKRTPEHSGLPLNPEKPFQWVVPAENTGTLFLRVTALDQNGKWIANDLEAPLVVEGGMHPTAPQMLEPLGGELWEGHRTVKIRWQQGVGTFVKNSAALDWRTDNGEWHPITRALENTGFYNWVPPARNTSTLQIRVTLDRIDKREKIESKATGNIRIRIRKEGNIKAAQAYYNRGRVLHAQKNLEAAAVEYQKALQEWSEYDKALHELGRLYLENGEDARALEYFLRSKEATPSDPLSRVNLARAEINLKLFNDAYQHLKDAVDLGVDRDQRFSLSTGELLREMANQFAFGEKEELAEEAFTYILKLRHADPRTRRYAQGYLTWLKNQSK